MKRNLLVLLMLITPGILTAQPVTEKAQKSAQKGERWLKSIQQDSGAWGCEAGAEADITTTSMALLALLSKGRFDDAQRLRSGVNYLLDTQKSKHGLFSNYDATGLGPLYDHFSALLALSQLYAFRSYRTKDIRNKIRQGAVMLSEVQNENGSWGLRRVDIGVSGYSFQALRSVNGVGISFTADLNKLLKFTKQYENKRTYNRHYKSFYWKAGKLRIQSGMGLDRSSVLREISEKKAGKEYRSHPNQRYGFELSEYDYAGLFMVSQAMMKKDYFKQWYRTVRDQLIEKQNDDGSWEVEYCKKCRGYATSVAVLFLRSPYRLLPVYQR